MNADWNAPPPRPGLAGTLDKLIGPGATPAEIALQFAAACAAAVAAPLYASYVVEGWTAAQYVACAVLAFDVVGGVVTNATSSAKRWYHRPGQGLRQHLGFAALHLAHLLFVSWLFVGLDLLWVFVAGGYLLLAALVVLSTPLYLRRPVALLAYAVGLLVALYVLRQPPGMEWFLPLFYLKLLVSHLLREEPYRPAVPAAPVA